MTTFAKLQKGVIRQFSVTKEELNGKCRDRRLVMARTILAGLARKHTDLSYPQLGRLMNRDHTTVIESRKRFDEMAKAAERAQSIEAEL